MRKLLKYARIVVSVSLLALITLFIVTPTPDIVKFTAWLAKIQLFPLALAFALGWFMLWIAVTLVFGRVYCSTVCPLGTLQDFFSRLRGKRPYRYAPPYNRFRYLMLTLAVGSAILGLTNIVEALDPYSDYAMIVSNLARPAAAGAIGLAVSLVLVAAIAAVAIWRGRLLCNTVCPVGTALGVVSRYSIYHIDIDTDLCIQCGKCAEVCKAQCIDLTSHLVDSSRCVNCFDCLPVCPNDAISYISQRKQLSLPMMQSLTPMPPQATNMSKN